MMVKLSNSELEKRRVIAWEQAWFRRVSGGTPGDRREALTSAGAEASRLIYIRIVRHAVWYLKARHREHQGDRDAARMLLECLGKMKRG